MDVPYDRKLSGVLRCKTLPFNCRKRRGQCAIEELSSWLCTLDATGKQVKNVRGDPVDFIRKHHFRHIRRLSPGSGISVSGVFHLYGEQLYFRQANLASTLLIFDL
jgi:hypothetical protein